MKKSLIISIEEKFEVLFPEMKPYVYNSGFPEEWLKDLPTEYIQRNGDYPWLIKRNADKNNHYNDAVYIEFAYAFIWNHILLSKDYKPKNDKGEFQHYQVPQNYKQNLSIGIGGTIGREVFIFKEAFWSKDNYLLLHKLRSLNALLLRFAIENELELFYNGYNMISTLLFNHRVENDIANRILKKECDAIAKEYGYTMPSIEKKKAPIQL
jgi:hypothetical protein